MSWEMCECERGGYDPERYSSCYDCFRERRSDYLTCILCGVRWHSPQFEVCYSCRRRFPARVEAAHDLRLYVLWRDDYTCRACGDRMDLTVDHIVPCRRGGTADPWNLQALCRPCNLDKRDHPPTARMLEYRGELLSYYFYAGKSWLNEEQRTACAEAFHGRRFVKPPRARRAAGAVVEAPVPPGQGSLF
jgi:5-methylcytosine-specific restriction endonuclease McrA